MKIEKCRGEIKRREEGGMYSKKKIKTRE